jgi:hypothetical protein
LGSISIWKLVDCEEGFVPRFSKSKRLLSRCSFSRELSAARFFP